MSTAPADILITHVTEARTTERAQAIARKYRPSVIRQAADQLHIDPEGHGVAWLRRAVVAEARAGVPERTMPASCPSPAHADELADFGDCSACGTVAPRLPAAKASAAETPGTIASACAFGWGA